MSLHNGIDTVAVISCGVFSKTYGVGEENNTANNFASLGYLEDAPEGVSPSITKRLWDWFWEFLE